VGKQQLIVGLDPGTGISSPTGFCCFDPITLDIYYAGNIGTKRKALQHRIKEISDIVENTLIDVQARFPEANITVAIESFVMRGKGGETLQRLIGSFLGRLPYHFNLIHVQNSTVKLIVGGHGRSSKEQVAAGLLTIFGANSSSLKQIEQLTSASAWDILDALAIGAAAWNVIQSEV
jgi:Holliday junction resolvasome RuvABC endonuclease subunit